MERVSKFLRLPVSDRRLLVKALVLVWAVRVGLWLLPFRMMRQLLARLGREPAGAQVESWSLVNRIGWAVRLASRYAPAATCLTQALVTKVMLSRQGYPASVRIGVARSETGQFQAHAWVESKGSVVFGGSEVSLKHYTVLTALDRGGW